MPVSNPNDLAIPESDVADQNNPGFWSQGMDPNGSDGTEPDTGSTAFDVMNQVMQYGRKKHGLLPNSPSRTNDNDEDDQPQPQQQASTPSYAEGGEVDGDEQGAIPEAEDNQDTQQEPQAQQGAGGMDKAWALTQAFRNKYNAYKSFAAAALNGAPGKAPDIMAAARAATQASPYALTGDTVNFAPGQNGVTATVTKFGQRQPSQQIPLSIPAFKQWLQGPAGSFDIMQKHGTSILSQLAGGGQQSAQTPHFARGGSADDDNPWSFFGLNMQPQSGAFDGSTPGGWDFGGTARGGALPVDPTNPDTSAGIPDQRAATPSEGGGSNSGGWDFGGTADGSDPLQGNSVGGSNPGSFEGGSASDNGGVNNDAVSGFSFSSQPDYSNGSGVRDSATRGGLAFDEGGDVPDDTLTPLSSDNSDDNTRNADVLGSKVINDKADSIFSGLGNTLKNAASALGSYGEGAQNAEALDTSSIPERGGASTPPDNMNDLGNVSPTGQEEQAGAEGVPALKKIVDYVRGAGQKPLAGGDRMSSIVSYLKGSNAAPAEAADAALAAASQSANHPGEAAVKAVVDAAQGKSAVEPTGRGQDLSYIPRMVDDFNKARSVRNKYTPAARPEAPQDPYIKMGYDPKLVQQARFRFPGRPELMQDYLDKQTQQGTENEISRTKAENPLGIARMKDQTTRDVATQKGNNYAERTKALHDAAMAKLSTMIQVEGMKEGNSQRLQSMRGAQVALSKALSDPRGPDMETAAPILKALGYDPATMMQGAPAAPQAPQPRTPQAPQPGQQQSAETRVINGRIYVKVPGGWKAQ